VSTILFNYVAVKIISALCIATLLCMALGEFVGISFEQMRFLTDNRISMNTSMFIHILAAPKFLVITLPYALLMANIVVYKELSRASEIIALRSFGVSVYKILLPSIGLSILITSFSFCCQEAIVTQSNYRAAVILEKAMNIDRGSIEKHDFVYSEFINTDQKKQINLLLHAKQAKSGMMNEVTLLKFEQGDIQKILIAPIAQWNPKEKIWNLSKGVEETIENTQYLPSNPFETYTIKLGDTLNQILNQSRDNNELRIFELRQKLNTFKGTGHEKEIRQLESNIQERFILPFSCIAFSLVGASIGISLKPKSSGNEFGLGLLIILAYYILQSIGTALVTKEVIPMWGMWIPSFSGIGFAFLRLAKFS
jgi:lipopolysaccharide export system permease protein